MQEISGFYVVSNFWLLLGNFPERATCIVCSVKGNLALHWQTMKKEVFFHKIHYMDIHKWLLDRSRVKDFALSLAGMYQTRQDFLNK